MTTQEMTTSYHDGESIPVAGAVTVPDLGGRTPGSRGFTLIELLMVVTIIGVLTAIAAPRFYLYREKARVSRAMSEIRLLEQSISAYALEKGGLPPDLTAIEQQNTMDPWGHPYVYHVITGVSDPVARQEQDGNLYNTDFDLYSKGIDDLSAPEYGADYPQCLDDVARTNNGSFVGLRY